jgi:hypothetical protein
MMSKEYNMAWLQRHTAEYHAGMNEVKEIVEDLDDVGKLGPRFSSVDELEEVSLGSKDVPWPTYVSRGLPEECKGELVELLKEFMDWFS